MGNDENIFDNEYALILFFFYLQQQQKTGEMLLELDKELRLSNRFFPNGKLIEIISSLSDISCLQIKKGTSLYRCRQIKKEEEKKFFEKLTEGWISLARNFVPTIDENSGVEEWIKLSTYFNIHKDELPRWERAYNQFVENYSRPSFWGYNEADSDAPPQGCSPSGRINPDGISYLYAASDIKTAILEVRPIPTQFVSVAQIEVVEDINIYSFAKPIQPDQEGKDWVSWIDYDEISKYFAQPNYGGSSYYLATQYISEFIKHMKTPDGQTSFDGLCFRSSLNSDGINYVLFDVSGTKKYRICNSAVHQINNLLGDSTCILPMT